MADRDRITSRVRALILLHEIIRDPIVAEAFRRTARDDGQAFALPAPDAPVLAGGALKAMEVASV